MSSILILKSSALGAKSASNQLIEHLQSDFPQAKVFNLHSNPPPYWDPSLVSHPETRVYVEELKKADLLIVAAPMYNFGVPGALKSWMDWVAIAGETFAYTEQGPKGLLTGKQAIIISTRGGAYPSDSSMDHQKNHLKVFLEFLGVTVHVVEAQGLNMGAAEPILTQARETLQTLTKTLLKH